MQKYFVTYFCETAAGLQTWGSSSVPVDAPILDYAAIVKIESQLKSVCNYKQCIILNWRRFEDGVLTIWDKIEFRHVHLTAEAVAFQAPYSSSALGLVVNHVDRGYLFSVPMSATDAERIAALFGKDLIHS